MQWIIDDIFQPALDLNGLLTSVHPNQIGFSFRKEGTQILNRMKAGLTRFENELSSHPPELIKEVKALQNICNGEGIANVNISYFEGANHYLQSDLEGCGKRGQKIVGRLIYPLPFPEAGPYENPSEKTKPEVVPEQPVETQAVVGNKNTKKKSRSKKVQEGTIDSDILFSTALTKHHGYEDGSCKNSDPITCTGLALLLNLGKNTASLFFKKKFKGHIKYVKMCSDSMLLNNAMKMLSGETASPHLLLGDAIHKVKARSSPELDDDL